MNYSNVLNLRHLNTLPSLSSSTNSERCDGREMTTQDQGLCIVSSLSNYSNGILNYPKWIARSGSLPFFIAISTVIWKVDYSCVVMRVGSMLRKHACLPYYIIMRCMI